MDLDSNQLKRFDSPLRGEVSNDRRMMVWNFFAVDTNRPCMTPIVYDDGSRRIEVKPGFHGIANILDKDFLIYVGSLMREKIAAGELPNRKFTFTAHDFCRIAHKAVGGSAYRQIREAIDRLQGTQVKTDIMTGGEGEEDWFSWIRSAKVNSRIDASGAKVMRSITIELCDWLHRAVLQDDQMLSYNSKYFELAPIPRRIYEIARSHIADGLGFQIDLETLKSHVGATSETRAFKYDLKKIVDVGGLLEFGVCFGDARTPMAGAISSATRVPLKHLMVIMWPRHIHPQPPRDFNGLPKWNVN
jgi:plasmid replication initiation protein